MAAFVPLVLLVAGGALCVLGQRAILRELTYRAITVGTVGVAFVAMGVVAMVLGLTP